MKKFLIVATQNNGCDYTIACGTKVWTELGKSLDEKIIEIKERLLGIQDDDEDFLCPQRLPGKYREYALDSLEIYELSDGFIDLDLNDLVKEHELKEKEKAEKMLRDKEYKQYQELKAKFEKLEKDLSDKFTCVDCKEGFVPSEKSELRCSSCDKIFKDKEEEKTRKQKEISEQRQKIYTLLIKDGWERKTQDSYFKYFNYFVKGKFKIESNGRIYIWDMIIPGKRKPSWRSGSFEEIKNELPSSVIDIVEKSPYMLLS